MAEIDECVRRVCKQNLIESAKLESLLTRSSYAVFFLIEYGKQVKSSSQLILAKLISVTQIINSY